jgi:hypothetical protein
MTDNITMSKARQRKVKISFAPSPEEVIRIEVFQIADSPPLAGGYYWHCAAHQLLRGPFATPEAADADAKQLATRLLSVILGIEIVGIASADPKPQTARTAAENASPAVDIESGRSCGRRG